MTCYGVGAEQVSRILRVGSRTIVEVAEELFAAEQCNWPTARVNEIHWNSMTSLP